MHSFFRFSRAIFLFGFWAAMALPALAATPQAIIWTMGNQTVPAYSDQTLVTARSDDLYNEAPLLLRWEVIGDRVRAVTFARIGCDNTQTVPAFSACEFATRPASGVLKLNLPPLAPGTYTLEVTNYDGRISSADQTRILTVLATPTVVSVASVGTTAKVFGSGYGDAKFFISASESDVAALLNSSAPEGFGPPWAVAEPTTLRAWPASGPAADIAKPVCRLYHPTLVTHFFSASASDCATVRATPPWRDEGIAFRALIPDAGGVCPIGTEPVWRLYSSKFQTHRYTRSSSTYTGFKANGWTPEGVVFCSAPG